MSSPTTNKGYTYPAHGGGVGTWDTNLNGNFEYQDLNLGGYYQITASSTTAAVTFGTSVATIPSTATSITFSASLAQNLFYNLTGARSQNLSINMPAAGSIYVFANNSSGATTTTVLPTGGSGVTLTQGGQTVVVLTSTGANLAQNAFGALTATSLATSSGITATGPITQNSSQYGKLATGDTAARPGAPTAGMTRYNTSLGTIEWWNGTAWIGPATLPTRQLFTTGTAQTYTAPAGVIRQRVRIGGPGGGGGAATTNAGSNGSANTSFQVNSAGTAWTAVLGQGGATSNGAGGVGGSGGTDGSTGTNVIRASGAQGSGGSCSGTAGVVPYAGTGGNGAFGGAGVGGKSGSAGTNANVNMAGGGGGGANTSTQGGGGGGAGEYVEFWVVGMTTATYTVGLGGAGGAAGANNGGNGGNGIIIVEEFYS